MSHNPAWGDLTRRMVDIDVKVTFLADEMYVSIPLDGYYWEDVWLNSTV